MNEPRCDGPGCADPGLHRCYGIIGDDETEDFRRCEKLLCLAHVAGTARIHFNPGGWRVVGYCAPCWEERQRFIAKRQAEIAAKCAPKDEEPRP